MKTSEFLQVAPKLTALNLFTNLKKGEHGRGLLGYSYFGTTKRHYELIWRTYGTLENLIIYKPASEVNKMLANAGITEFKARRTKSGELCRLVEVR